MNIGLKGTFVFVVCGAAEHINTLHFSLRYLQKFSKNEIIVLTDPSRNEVPVVHSNIINVQTPKEFDHHQASIFLKVGIHRHLPKGKDYCYLDTDVIALSTEVDDIFKESVEPIRFAADHCRVNEFSPHAVTCNCLKDKLAIRKKLQKALDVYTMNKTPERKIKARLEKEFERLRTDRFYKIRSDIRYMLSYKKFRLNNEFYFDKRKKVWYDNRNIQIMFDPDIARIERETGLTYVDAHKTWVDADGNDMWLDNCDHLTEQILSKFDITVADRQWQHWNGGVFLFNDKSHEFLDAWFNRTMEIFKDPQWRTRDQGTLIATAWEFGLQDQVVLNPKWNFIADHTNPDGGLNEDTGAFTTDGFRTEHYPALVHIYHHFGDTEWYLWNWIVKQFDRK